MELLSALCYMEKKESQTARSINKTCFNFYFKMAANKNNHCTFQGADDGGSADNKAGVSIIKINVRARYNKRCKNLILKY